MVEHLKTTDDRKGARRIETRRKKSMRELRPHRCWRFRNRVTARLDTSHAIKAEHARGIEKRAGPCADFEQSLATRQRAHRAVEDIRVRRGRVRAQITVGH